MDHIKKMREELNEVDSKIAQLKKQAKPEPQGNPTVAGLLIIV